MVLGQPLSHGALDEDAVGFGEKTKWLSFKRTKAPGQARA